MAPSLLGEGWETTPDSVSTEKKGMKKGVWVERVSEVGDWQGYELRNEAGSQCQERAGGNRTIGT